MSISHIARMPGFGREVITDGHPSTPNANKNGHGPSWRMIVDLQDTVRALGVYPGGQSGNPGSKHYDDLLEYWAEGKYYECLFLRSQDQKSDRIKFIQKFKRA
jgi:penicillin amidase